MQRASGVSFMVVALVVVLCGQGYAYQHTIQEYKGPETCLNCHFEAASQMFGAPHYQWRGPTPNVTNIEGYASKGDRGFNTYCGAENSSRRFTCSTCHVGNGGAPKPTLSREQLNNIDCLTCHQERYRRQAAPPYEAVSFTGFDGVTRTWNLPVEDQDGSFSFMPNEAAMGISILEAVNTVHLPTRASCLSCHAYAAGSDCGKRGDLSSFTVSPPVWAEVHMSPQGQNLSCRSCHLFQDHLVLGRGLDLRHNERPGRLTCLTGGCHTSTPHGNQRLDGHTGRVACQTCHIPVYANLQTTEVDRDWLRPFFSQGLLGGQGGFKPEEIRAGSLVPSYRWFDGTSRVYALGQQPIGGDQGVYELGLPNGTVRTPGAMIYPMKEHSSNSAMHDATGQMIPFSTFTFFVTGDFARAVADGQAYSGLIGPWSLVQVHTFQTINHGVMPSDYALQCGACHGSLPGGPVRMDLQGALGYELKAGRNVVCLQCHGPEDSKPFLAIHEKHVTDRKFDCSWCHSFTRETEVAPAKDIVTIQSAAFDPVGRTLTLVATSSGQPQVSLAAEGLGPLQYKSWKGFYRSTFSGVNEAPANVTVMSSGGGWELRPVPFPVTDLVTVQSIAHDPAGQTMTVVATSSNQPGAALTAAGFGDLDWKSWLNFYRKTFTGVAVKPETVTVTSSGRGWDTRPVPFPQDSVSIQSIAYDAVNQSLTVIATSSDQPQVTLTAEGLGPLAWKSWLNFYRMTFGGVATKPASVTVNSNLGGTATVPVP